MSFNFRRIFIMLKLRLAYFMNNKRGLRANFGFPTRKSSVTKVNIFLCSSRLNIVTPTPLKSRKRRAGIAQSHPPPQRLNTRQVSENPLWTSPINSSCMRIPITRGFWFLAVRPTFVDARYTLSIGLIQNLRLPNANHLFF